MTKPLLDTPRAVEQRRSGNRQKEYVRLLEQALFATRSGNQEMIKLALADVEAFRKGSL